MHESTCHVIDTIITISTTWYFNQSLLVSHTTGSSYWSPHSSWTHPDMVYGYHYPNERVDCSKQSTENMKSVCDWFKLWIFYNLTTVAKVKRVEPPGEMRWKLFSNIIFLLSSLFKEREKEGMNLYMGKELI